MCVTECVCVCVLTFLQLAENLLKSLILGEIALKMSHNLIWAMWKKLFPFSPFSLPRSQIPHLENERELSVLRDILRASAAQRTSTSGTGRK